LSAEFRQRILGAFGQDEEEQGFQLDHRSLNAFFMSSGWNSFVESLGDRVALHRLVSVPTSGVYCKLETVITMYYLCKVRLLPNNNYLLRRHLNNKDR
jgi:hypothetical protein